MIEFLETREGFKLLYKKYLILNHSKENPCIKIGKGTARYRSRLGEFKIKEKLQKEIPLVNYEIAFKNETEVILVFRSLNCKLKLLIKTLNEYLEIIPECLDPKINRFWISIQADPNEAIYGCGEQYSELNLRGKEVPLWVEEQGFGRGDPPATGDWYTTYYPQPTYVSSNNYFCHVETTSYAKFNFKNENFHELYIWHIPERILFGKYETALEVVSELSDYLGRQVELPDWAYDGVWLGIQG